MENNRRLLTFVGIRLKNTDLISIHWLVCRFISYRACRRVVETLDLTPREMAPALGINQRELLRLKKPEGRLRLAPSDGLYRITRSLVIAIELFRGIQKAASLME